MKATVIAAAVAAALALPAFAQQKNDTTLPNSQERAQNREKVQGKVDKAESKLPDANERAQNREKVTDTAASAKLTTKVKAALADDVGMRTVTTINVDSNDGVVTLKGKVASADVKKRAGEIAKKVSGVKSVKNELTIEKKG